MRDFIYYKPKVYHGEYFNYIVQNVHVGSAQLADFHVRYYRQVATLLHASEIYGYPVYNRYLRDYSDEI